MVYNEIYKEQTSQVARLKFWKFLYFCILQLKLCSFAQNVIHTSEKDRKKKKWENCSG